MRSSSKIKASIFSLLLAGSLAFTPASLAFATSGTPEGETTNTPSTEQTGDDTTIEKVDDEWVVTFNGSEMQSDFSDMIQAVADMQPGDSELFKIKLVNDCDEEVDWYVKNYVSDSMEDDAQNALAASISGGAYSYELLYYEQYQEGEDVDTSLGTPVYENENLGGDNATEVRTPVTPSEIASAEPNAQSVSAQPRVGTGANEATTGGLLNATNSNSNSEYFYLGRFAPGDTRMMTLGLGIDGETHTNAYFNTNAGVVIGYAAEPVGTGEEIFTTERETTYQYERGTRTIGGDLPQTGDMLPTISIICLILGLLVLACGLASWMNDRRGAKRGQN